MHIRKVGWVVIYSLLVIISKLRNLFQSDARMIIPLLSFCYACQPATISNDAKFDFETYPIGCINTMTADIPSLYSYYLKTEMENESGFVKFYISCGDLPVDLKFAVTAVITSYSSGNYTALVSYEAKDNDGQTIKAGSSTDDADDANEAVEDAIDEMVLSSFMRAYRI